MNAPLVRRGLLQASTVTLGAAMLPACITASAALPTAFDPAGFVADLQAAGYRVTVRRPVLWPGEPVRRSTYTITPPKGRGFGASYTAVMDRWSGVMDACPNHVERVVAHVFDHLGRAAA